MSVFRICAMAALGLSMVWSAAAAAPPPLEAYGRLPRVEFMRLSPAGGYYAYISVVGDSQRLFVVPIDGGKPVAVNFDPSNKIRNVEWAGDDYVAITISAATSFGRFSTVDTLEAAKVVILSVKTGAHYIAFDGHAEMLPFVYGRHSYARIDGRWCGFFGAITLAKSVGGRTYLRKGIADLYRVDLDGGAALLVAKGGEGIEGWLVGPDGKVVTQTNYFEKTGAWQISAGLFGTAILSGRSLINSPSVVGLGQTADTVLVYNPDTATRTFQSVPLGGGAPTDVPDGRRIKAVLFDDLTGLWIGEKLEGDTPRIVLFAPEQKAKMAGVAKAFANYNVDLVSSDSPFNRLIVRTDGGDDSGTYWLANLDKHAVESIGQAYPDVKETDVGPVRVVDWKAADGLEMHGVLTLPPGRPAHGLPVVVLPHGGPQARDYPRFDWWAQAFASRGYAVFQPNFRGSAGYGQPFVDAGHGQWGRKMQTDISDGLAALAAQGLVDPKRACIVGASYGGYAALAGVTVQNGLYRCAVADAPVADLGEMLKYEDAMGGYQAANATMRYWKQFMGADSDAGERLKAISPANLAARADAPILLIHGKDDSVVPISQSLEMQAALKRAGKPVEMVVMPNEDHWLSRPETRLSMLTAAVAFVQKYNPAD